MFSWVKFSALLTYTIIFVLNIIQLYLSYELFVSRTHYSFLFETQDLVAIYHKNNSNIYWFLFSSFVSFFLFASNVIYYTYYYSGAFRSYILMRGSQEVSVLDFLNEDKLFMYNYYDFVSISANTSWSILWSIHILLDILLRSLSIEETGKLFTLLSTQVSLVALRYPLLFQKLGQVSSNVTSNVMHDDIIEKIGLDFERETKKNKHVELANSIEISI